jgi:hypothetical protein
MDGLTRTAHNAYGIGLTLAGEKDFDAKHDAVIFESFLSTNSNYDARMFTKTEADVLNIEKKLNMFEVGNPDKYLDIIADNPMAEVVVDTFNKQVASQLKPLQTEAKAIRIDPNLSPKDRADMLKENKMLQNMTKKNITENIQDLKEYQ